LILKDFQLFLQSFVLGYSKIAAEQNLLYRKYRRFRLMNFP